MSNRRRKRQGMHREDVKAALAKRGFSLAGIARDHGYAARSASNVWSKPWSQMQAIIAEPLDIHPMEIWPDRYDEDGNPIGARAARVTHQLNATRSTEQNSLQ